MNDLHPEAARLPPSVLVLDDYHVLQSAAVHEALTFLLDHLPRQLHLVVVTREDPPLPLARLRARRQLNELRSADLRFTPQEAATFLIDVMGLSLSAETITALDERTEGWIAGLQLAALAMRERDDLDAFVRGFTGSNRFVLDYLVTEVVERMPDHLQRFVLQTAILERMCAPLCDAVVLDAATDTQSAYSELLLAELERLNLFLVALDDERQWYRYHHLFGEVLRGRLRGGATGETVATLYLRASRWFEQQELIDEAVQYALLASDVARAASLIEQYSMAIILAKSDVLLVQAWVKELPYALIHVRPRLAVVAGLVMLLTGQFDAFERLLVDAVRAFSAPDLPANIAGEVAALRSTFARFQGNADRTLAFAREALEHLDQDNHGFRAAVALNSGVAYIQRGEIVAAKASLAEAARLGELGRSPWMVLAALNVLNWLQLRQGQLQHTLQTAERAVQVVSRLGGGQIPAEGMGYVAIGEVLYERNDLDGAMRALTRGLELLRGTVEVGTLARGYVVVAQIHQARGNHAGTWDSMRRGEEWFAQTQIASPGAFARLAAGRARLWIAQGDLRAAAQWAKECTLPSDSELDYVQQLTLVRLRLAQSRHNPAGPFMREATEMLAQLLPVAEARGWARYVIETLVLQALVYQVQGDQSCAVTVLTRALSLAEAEDYVRIFVDEGAPMAALLRALCSHTTAAGDQPYYERVLAAFDEGAATVVPPPSSQSLPPDVEPLSQRELEVLRLVAAGASNGEIAQQLIVTLGTVKKHVNNIFGKLAVQSRTQAIVRARELQIL